MNYKLDLMVGNNFTYVAEKAKKIATEKQVIVEFDFNEIICLVNNSTNLDWLWRDYSNADRMEWKTIGSDCVSEYDSLTKAELYKRNVAAEIKAVSSKS